MLYIVVVVQGTAVGCGRNVVHIALFGGMVGFDAGGYFVEWYGLGIAWYKRLEATWR